MSDCRFCSVFVWALIGMTIFLVLMQQMKLLKMTEILDEKSSIRMMKSGETVLDENEVLPGPYNLLEDAARHSNAMDRPTKECTLDFMNHNRLQQDHPCVINYIRKNYLIVPPSQDNPLQLDYPTVEDPSDGQPNKILKLLNNKTNGFFVECGALDGENLSNTLYLERFFNWTGILIEADQDSFVNLLSRKRKTWALPVCLSVKPYPTKVTFRINYALGQIIGIGMPEKNLTGKTSSRGRDIHVQCFPIYSILLAVARTKIDYFSLDVEGHELLILKTIPFQKVYIKTISVEWTGGEVANMGKEAIRMFMKKEGYQPILPDDTADLLFELQN